MAEIPSHEILHLVLGQAEGSGRIVTEVIPLYGRGLHRGHAQKAYGQDGNSD